MKVKYSEIISAEEPLSLISKKEVTVKEAVSIARIIKTFREEFSIYQEKRKELLDKYGSPADDGRYKFNDEESAKAFGKDYSDLVDFEVDLSIEPAKLTSNIKIDAETVIAVEKFINFE